MARQTKPLNNTQVQNAKAREKEYNLMDGEGLKLRVKPNGTKTWLYNYTRPYTTKRANMTIGRFPGISLAEAREEAIRARKLLAQNIDPQEHIKELTREEELAHSNTFEAIATKWMDIKRTKVTHAHAQGIWRSLQNHLFKELGGIPISKLKARVVIAVLEPIAARGSLETVKRLSQRINEIMTYAVNTEYLEANPLAGISHAFEAPQKQNMPTIKPEQLPQLMQTLSKASIKLTTRCLIEWQLHTMTRPAEAAGATWKEIDWDKHLWIIPAERMKKRRAHIVPLTEQTLALLEFMQPISGNREHIFPADRNPRSHANAQTANMALKRMGFKGELVAHGLRALASTTLNDNGFDPDVIEAALAHSDSNEVRAAYNRSEYLERRKKMMTWWSETIAQAATGNLSIATSSPKLRVVIV